MATLQEILDEYRNQGAQVAEIAADINDLLDRIAGGTLTEEERNAALAEAQARTAALQQIAALHTPTPPPQP